MMLNDNQQAFFALLRAGLWKRDVRLSCFGALDFAEIYRHAEAQTVVGTVAAGIAHLVDRQLPQEAALTFAGATLQLEQQNLAMNRFIAQLVKKMRSAGIDAVLVKGQGVAQCYAQPLWRACGDVDLFLDRGNYEKAKAYLTPLALHVDAEDGSRLHLGMTIDSWLVELHGTMRSGLAKRIDDGIDDVQRDVFGNSGVRVWNNAGIAVYLPSADNDVIIIFTHFLGHFCFNEVVLRQICDWCRLLWAYRSNLNLQLLEKRLNDMGLMTEWKAFAAFAVKWLGMPKEAMPFYDSSNRYGRKADRICELIAAFGNFHSDGSAENLLRQGMVRRAFHRIIVFSRLMVLFPKGTPRFFLNYLVHRMGAV